MALSAGCPRLIFPLSIVVLGPNIWGNRGQEDLSIRLECKFCLWSASFPSLLLEDKRKVETSGSGFPFGFESDILDSKKDGS